MDLHARARAVHGPDAVPDVDGPVLATHAERLVYPVADRVVKIDVDPDRLGVEAATQRTVRAAGCPAPEVLAFHRGAPAVLVTAYVVGEALADGEPPHAGPDARWRSVGRALRVLHGTPVDGRPAPVFGGRRGWWEWFTGWVPYERRLMAGAGALPGADLDLLCGYAADAFGREPEPALRQLHGDCGPYHWLLRGEEVVAAVDFGDTGLGDPAWDLAVLTLFDPERLPAVLDGYRAGPGFRAHLARLLLPYQIIRHLAAHSWLVAHGFDPAPTVEALRVIAGRLRRR